MNSVLLELGVFGFGLLQDGDVGIGVFPEGKEVLISDVSFGGVAGKRIGAGEPEVDEGADGLVGNDAPVVEDFLKLSGGLRSLARLQVSLSAHMDGIQSKIGTAGGRRRSQVVPNGWFQRLKGLGGIVATQCELPAKRGQIVELHHGIFRVVRGEAVDERLRS